MSSSIPPDPTFDPVEVLRQAQAFLAPLLPPSIPYPTESRPHVTLTYAQSLDGKIAGAHGKQLRLSGGESMLFTHLLRAKHDAILVGIGTVLADDPQLNVRLLPPLVPTTSPSTSTSTSNGDLPPWPSPQPLILDPHLRLPLQSKLLTNPPLGNGKAPWVVCAAVELPDPAHPEMKRRKARLSEAGAEVFELSLVADGHLSLPDLLALLFARGIRSLMVEGGQRVITSFLASGLVDLLIVTVAPTLVGPAGVGFARETTGVGEDAGTGKGTGLPRLRSVRTEVFGRDAVMALVPVRE